MFGSTTEAGATSTLNASDMAAGNDEYQWKWMMMGLVLGKSDVRMDLFEDEADLDRFCES